VRHGLLIHEISRSHNDSRTPLDELSLRRRGLCPTIHNIHNRETSMSPVGFEPIISASVRLQTYPLDRAATGTGNKQTNKRTHTHTHTHIYIYIYIYIYSIITNVMNNFLFPYLIQPYMFRAFFKPIFKRHCVQFGSGSSQLSGCQRPGQDGPDADADV
jgi:hypothetical protein